jgi:hypothetical protein
MMFQIRAEDLFGLVKLTGFYQRDSENASPPRGKGINAMEMFRCV